MRTCIRLLVCALALIAIGASPAFADTPGNGPPTTRVVGNTSVRSFGGHALVTHPVGQVAKDSYDPSVDLDSPQASGAHAFSVETLNPPANPDPPCTSGYYRGLSGSNSKPANAPTKPSSTFQVKFETAWAYYWIFQPNQITRMCVQDGHSWVVWFGSNPYNADKIGLTDTWGVDGLGVSVSVSGSGLGGGVSTTSQSVSWFPGYQLNAWREDHYYGPGIDFYAINLWGCNESHTGDLKLGTNWFHVGASGTC